MCRSTPPPLTPGNHPLHHLLLLRFIHRNHRSSGLARAHHQVSASSQPHRRSVGQKILANASAGRPDRRDGSYGRQRPHLSDNLLDHSQLSERSLHRYAAVPPQLVGRVSSVLVEGIPLLWRDLGLPQTRLDPSSGHAHSRPYVPLRGGNCSLLSPHRTRNLTQRMCSVITWSFMRASSPFSVSQPASQPANISLGLFIPLTKNRKELHNELRRLFPENSFVSAQNAS